MPDVRADGSRLSWTVQGPAGTTANRHLDRARIMDLPSPGGYRGVSHRSIERVLARFDHA